MPVMGLCRGKTLTQLRLDLEARVGIEPTNAAFAEPCLTTWLPRRPKEHKQYGRCCLSQVKVGFERCGLFYAGDSETGLIRHHERISSMSSPWSISSRF